ncbi:hypothetical protein F5051DRAFT_392235 [Lentinula edodes]|nr:hypothetical protein F5051DRAFT_392235 [Lentinula edodes]
MHFSVATYLIMGLAAQCTVNALMYPEGYRKDILWSYRVLPDARFPAHSTATPTAIKEAAKNMVNRILKENSHGLPRLSADSPEFIGDPDSVSISITSRIEVGGLMCPCNANLKVDHEKGLIHTELYNDLTGVH